MTGVKFVTVTELDKRATALVAEAEQTRTTIVITKKGKPVAALQRIKGKEKGKEETVSNLKNNALIIISEIEKSGKRFIITRDSKPVASLQKIMDEDFCIDK